MKKNILLLLFVILLLKSKAQIPTINHDNWQAVNTYSVSNTLFQDFNKSVMIEDKLMMIVDTFSGSNPYSRKGIFEYNTTTRNTGTFAYPIQDGDRGIQSVTAYKTSTPGLTYGIFGCYSGSSVGDNYPVYYTYNSLTSSFTSDSINIGTSSDFEGGISHIAMFSPTTNHDTIRFFAKMNSGTQVYKKQINQTSIMPDYSIIGIEYVSHSIVFNDLLYVAGDSSDTNYTLLKESVDGRTFVQPNNINNMSFLVGTKIALLDTLNGKLLIGLNFGSNLGFEFFSYDGNVLQFLFAESTGNIVSYKHFKNRLWYSTSYFDSGSTANYAFLYSIQNNLPLGSVEAIGAEAIDGNYMSLVGTTDSLYFVGNKGTFQPSIIMNGNNDAEQRYLALNDRYLEVHKLMPPVSSFNYNNNQICLNASETFTSTSQNTDSLHWLVDGTYYSSSPGPSAWMNINFPTTGNHSVGLVAFGGTLKDTSFLSVNVYSISVAVSGQTLVCLGNSFVMTSTVTGAVGTPTLGWRDYISSPSTDLSTSSSLTYSPTLGATAYQFYLISTDVHGCSATSNTIVAQCNPLYQIDGQALTGLSPTITPVSGDVTLYKYQSFLGRFDSISTSPIGVVGDFNFASMPEGDYILKAVPSASSLQISYYGTNAISWKDALPFSHTCLSQTTNSINVLPLDIIGTGPCEISGKLIEGNGFVQRLAGDAFKPLFPGQPIGGIIVKGGRNPGGQMFSQTVTPGILAGSAHGTYTFSNLPYGDYFILVDIPGLDTNGTYHVNLSATTPSVSALDFIVDSMYINPIGSSVNLITHSNSVLNNSISIYPNPATNQTKIKYELINEANVEIELFDLVGRKTKTIIEKSVFEKNKYEHTIPLNELSSGVYFIKFKINNSENVIKLIITN